MPEIAQDTLSKIDELVEHIDIALAWVINYADKHGLELDRAAQFHIHRIETLLQEINQPFSKQIVTPLGSDKPPRDKLPVYLQGGSPTFAWCSMSRVTWPYYWLKQPCL
jgi:hypothetical protein